MSPSQGVLPSDQISDHDAPYVITSIRKNPGMNFVINL